MMDKEYFLLNMMIQEEVMEFINGDFLRPLEG